MYIYIYIYIYIYVCINIYIYICVCIYVCAYFSQISLTWIKHGSKTLQLGGVFCPKTGTGNLILPRALRREPRSSKMALRCSGQDQAGSKIPLNGIVCAQDAPPRWPQGSWAGRETSKREPCAASWLKREPLVAPRRPHRCQDELQGGPKWIKLTPKCVSGGSTSQNQKCEKTIGFSLPNDLRGTPGRAKIEATEINNSKGWRINVY